MSKAAQDLLGSTYFNAHGLDIIRLRIELCWLRRTGEVVSILPEGARRSTLVLLARNFMWQSSYEACFLDVRDAVEGFWALQEKGKGGEAYNISGADAVSMQQLLDVVLSGCSKSVQVVRDLSLVRSVDELIYWNDLSKIERHTGWKPHRALRETVEDMIEWWKTELSKAPEGGNKV